MLIAFSWLLEKKSPPLLLQITFLFKKKNHTLDSVALMVGASSHTLNGSWFHFQSGHIPKWRVWSLLPALACGRQPIRVSVSHQCFSLSLSLSLFLSLSQNQWTCPLMGMFFKKSYYLYSILIWLLYFYLIHCIFC